MEFNKLTHYRSRKRIKELGEVFTQKRYVYQMLNLVGKSVWADDETIFFEPTCGHGNFVVAIVQKRLDAFFKKAQRQQIKNPHLYAIANTLDNLWAIDIDRENINRCRNRVWNTVVRFASAAGNRRAFLANGGRKNRHFWAHVLCCIKWQVHENEMLSALEQSAKEAQKRANQTIVSKKWLLKNNHRPINFELSWSKHFRSLKNNGSDSLEFSRGLKFIDAFKLGFRQGSFGEFVFAHPHNTDVVGGIV